MELKFQYLGDLNKIIDINRPFFSYAEFMELNLLFRQFIAVIHNILWLI